MKLNLMKNWKPGEVASRFPTLRPYWEWTISTFTAWPRADSFRVFASVERYDSILRR